MKLYTRPRPLQVGQLRPGDQLAMFSGWKTPITDWTTYVDKDLSDELAWAGVVDATGLGEEAVKRRRALGDITVDAGRVAEPQALVVHTMGEIMLPRTKVVIVREVIELDPLTYVRPVMGDDGQAA